MQLHWCHQVINRLFQARYLSSGSWEERELKTRRQELLKKYGLRQEQTYKHEILVRLES